MTEQTTVLVPIRYPLTDESAQTLAAASRVVSDRAPAHLSVLHVNLYQNGQPIQTKELTQAISSTVNDVETSVITRQGFLIEEAILDEATQIDADVIVLGTDQHALWRRLLRRLFGNDPDIGTFLSEHTTDATEVMEVNAADKTPIAE